MVAGDLPDDAEDNAKSDDWEAEDRDDSRASPQAEYALALHQWREDVRACRNGYYEYCARR